MIRIVVLGAAVAAIALGCGSTPTPSGSSAVRQSSAVSSVRPTSTAAVTPVATAPTQSAALGTPPLIGGPTAGPVEDLGAHLPLFVDEFDDQESGWGTGTTGGAVVAYANGTLQFTAPLTGNWALSPRVLETPQNVVRLEADFTPSASGFQGLLCANGDDEYFGAATNAEGRWTFVRVTLEGSTVLSTGQGSEWLATPGATTRLAIDCAGTASGGFRLQLSLPELGTGVSYVGGGSGPPSFDRVVLYGESAADGYSLAVDDAAAYGDSG